jgi:hypothetical protein
MSAKLAEDGVTSSSPASSAERGDHIEEGGGAVDAPQYESDGTKQRGDHASRPQQPMGRPGSVHADAAAIASRGTGRSRMCQWIAAAKSPSPIAIHHIRS